MVAGAAFLVAAASVALTVAAPWPRLWPTLQPTGYMTAAALAGALGGRRLRFTAPRGSVFAGLYLGFLAASIILFRVADPVDDPSDLHGRTYPLFAWWVALLACGPPALVFFLVSRTAQPRPE